jgi:hypothetical protein
MAVLVTAIWVVMLVVSKHLEKKQVSVAPEAARRVNMC